MTNAIVSIPLSDFISQIEETVKRAISENSFQQEDKLLNSDQVIKLLGISTTTLQAWRDNKKIPFKRIGKKMFYSKSEILKMLSNTSV